MRANGQSDQVAVKAYAGTTGVLLAFDIDPAAREGLLGFAVERSGGNRPQHFLPGLAQFPGMQKQPGELVLTDEAPIQKFRWSDYRVFPDTEYQYTIHPVRGEPGQLKAGNGPTVTVRTSDTATGDHRVLFNRAAAASQAFQRDFPEVADELAAARREHRDPVMPARALTWLSRGVLEQIVGFCARATDPTWALDVAIYEYELPAIVDAVDAARDRGAHVRIIYHAKDDDPQTAENESHLAGWPPEDRRARITSKIFHDKFVVLSRIHQQNRTPISVLCGSTNFTPNGVYRQANVVHIAEVAGLAEAYLALFEVVFRGDDPAHTRAWIDEHNPLDADTPVYAGFSPRSGHKDLDLFAAEISTARRDVIFCTAFDIDDRLESALLGAPHDDVLRLGLQNRASGITGIHRDRTADFVAAAYLKDGLEGYLKESTAGQKGNILIHTKLVVVDFTSDAPTVISGSHNLSASASSGNDENFLILRGHPDVADCYAVEAMRLYDHYRMRWHLTHPDQPGQTAIKAPTLATDDGWTERYFADGTLPCADRTRFAGTA